MGKILEKTRKKGLALASLLRPKRSDKKLGADTEMRFYGSNARKSQSS